LVDRYKLSANESGKETREAYGVFPANFVEDIDAGQDDEGASDGHEHRSATLAAATAADASISATKAATTAFLASGGDGNGEVSSGSRPNLWTKGLTAVQRMGALADLEGTSAEVAEASYGNSYGHGNVSSSMKDIATEAIGINSIRTTLLKRASRAGVTLDGGGGGGGGGAKGGSGGGGNMGAGAEDSNRSEATAPSAPPSTLAPAPAQAPAAGESNCQEVTVDGDSNSKVLGGVKVMHGAGSVKVTKQGSKRTKVPPPFMARKPKSKPKPKPKPKPTSKPKSAVDIKHVASGTTDVGSLADADDVGLAEKNGSQSSEKLGGSVGGGGRSCGGGAGEDRVNSTGLAASCTRVVAAFSYRAQSEDELSFTEGDAIEVIIRKDDGWFAGHLLRKGSGGEVGGSVREGAYGFFPANFVRQQPSDK
jgi:hypothetical protein